MSKLRKLLLGLILFFLFGYWCIYVRSAPTIQNDIKKRATSALEKAGYNSVKLDVQGRDIMLTGTVSKESLRGVVEQVTNVEGVRFIENQITVDNSPNSADGTDYYLNVTKSDTNKLKLDGYIADALTHHNFVSYVMENFNATSIEDHLIEKANPPEGWTAISKSGLDALKQLQAGSLQISNGQVQLSGKVLSNKNRKEIIEQLSTRLPNNIETNTRLDIAIAAIEPVDEEQKLEDSNAKQEFTTATCQEKINETLSKAPISFKSGSSIMDPNSFSLLDEIIKIKAQCPMQMMHIKGHTDALGDKSLNQNLSEQRAIAVRTYFIEKGLDENNITTEGFGERLPIADNRSWKGREMNRRIEITIKESK